MSCVELLVFKEPFVFCLCLPGTFYVPFPVITFLSYFLLRFLVVGFIILPCLQNSHFKSLSRTCNNVGRQLVRGMYGGSTEYRPQFINTNNSLYIRYMSYGRILVEDMGCLLIRDFNNSTSRSTRERNG